MSGHTNLQVAPRAPLCDCSADDTPLQISGTLARLGIPGAGLWHQLIDNLFTFVAVVSRDGTVLDINRAALPSDLSVEEIVGKPLWDCYWWSPAAGARKEMQAAISAAANGDFIRRKLTFQLASASPMVVDGAFAPLRDVTGKIIAVICSGVDVSKRELARAALIRTHRDLLMLSASNRCLVGTADERALLSGICQTIVEVGNYSLAWVELAEQGQSQSVRIAAAAGSCAECLRNIHAAGDTSPAEYEPVERATRDCRPYVCANLAEKIAFQSWMQEAVGPKHGSSISLPLTVNGVGIGALNIYSNQHDAFDQNERELLTRLADDLAYGVAALRKRLEHEQAEHRIERLTRVLRMQSSINAAVPRLRASELLQEVCRVATELGGYERAVYWSVDPKTRRTVLLCNSGEADTSTEFCSLELGDGTEPDTSLTGRALRTGELTVCNDLNRSEPPIAGRAQFVELGYKSLVALPLLAGSRRLGALLLGSKDVNRLGDEELLLLEEIRATLCFALEMREQAGAAEQMARFDPQTGLASRQAFCERLAARLQTRSNLEGPLSVAAFDIHALASINDTFGRRNGDLILQTIAERLDRAIEDTDRIAYLGGGVFAMMRPGDASSAESVAEMLDTSVFGTPFEVGGDRIRITYTLGLASSEPQDEICAEMLVQNAEAALNRAKETGEQYLQYRLQMHGEIAERLALEHRLRTALDEQQFEVYYQPQVNAQSGEIESAEALLRWNDPVNGLTTPGVFLPVLETSGMIVPIGQWVLRQVVQDCKRWRSLGAAPLRVSVNVSAVQLRRRSFIQDAINAAAALNELSFGLDLEITETSLLQDLDSTTARLNPLRAAGIRIALDDFGTGYSSLGLLTKLPVDELKIDRSFISGLPADAAHLALTSSIVQLASAFGLATIAEGVETYEQLNQLRTLGCTRIQGYLYSKPLPQDPFQRLLLRGALAEPDAVNG